jgi:hypothetical protein
VLYGDSCSGIPGALHERTFAEVNAVVARLSPAPEFIIFPGDEIAGLVVDPDELRAQWRHWLDTEMRWLDRTKVPLWHCTGNHTAYDAMSEAVFREVLDLPRNGPPGQQGLSYWVRRGDLLLVFVHTLWTGLGGEGHVETDWLRQTLEQHADARHKFVVGHHPVFPVNGFSGAYVREVGPEHASGFWDVLVTNGVTAYLCSHILAFDVQVHRGVLQITTAGAGTAHRMPEGVEYLHCVQVALDDAGLRYQVLDTGGRVRESLAWPPTINAATECRTLLAGEHQAPLQGKRLDGRALLLRVHATSPKDGSSVAQTLMSAFDPDVMARLWIGLRGRERRLTLTIAPEPRRSPQYWIGPAIEHDASFELLIQPDMGPGGIMYRAAGDGAWSSLEAASPWGPERLDWPSCWSIGHGQSGLDDRPFLGRLTVGCAIIG